jgi:adenosylcobinamide kinase/adenosylcobinamide-phosphate guanylyltransferase
MSKLIFITGGARSGKSSYAQKLADTLGGKRAFVATCPPLDGEMVYRIKRHQKERGPDWVTLEAPEDLVSAFNTTPTCDVYLLDCLTLWINNLMFRAQESDNVISEDDAAARCHGLIELWARVSYTVIVVSNEVGMGIVPADASTRRYRDLVGRANQVIARAADEAWLMSSGIPVRLK